MLPLQKKKKFISSFNIKLESRLLKWVTKNKKVVISSIGRGVEIKGDNFFQSVNKLRYLQSYFPLVLVFGKATSRWFFDEWWLIWIGLDATWTILLSHHLRWLSVCVRKWLESDRGWCWVYYLRIWAYGGSRRDLPDHCTIKELNWYKEY